MHVLGIIPARYGSTRFPGKPLVPVAGKPLLQHVIERCLKAWTLSDVIVATDDQRIAELAARFCRVEMTDPNHASGSDRVAEVASRRKCAGVINIQGDEPLIDPEVINKVACAISEHPIATAAIPLRDPADYENPNVVKVVVNHAGQALYFSRRTIPSLRDGGHRPVLEQLAAFPFLKHLGIYGYQKHALLNWIRLPASPLEQAEQLEQLRALEHGIPIAVVQVDCPSAGIDAPEDVTRVEQLLMNNAVNP